MAQEKWLVDGPRTIDIEWATSIKVGLYGGQISVIAQDEPGIRVDIHSVSGKPLLVSVEGDVLEIDHPQIGWDNFLDVFTSVRGTAKADITLTVPRDVALKLGVVSAEALVSGLAATASLSTVSGDLVLDSHSGPVQVNAVSAEVSIRDHTGDIAVRTVSGDVTASGAIEKLSLDGVSGDVFLDLAGVPDSVRINTVSGGITARLEPDVPIRYRINTASGRLQLDGEHLSRVYGSYDSSFGALDQRFVDFRANTVSGGISVLHQVTA
ncbi:DUF4097 family beta strand repeat-containing protein [Herbiconiux sp. L3-i23]|uniref:DUF4097 family beta strand repeat-containing protein n=1 Tax=Herbiconiux sp. L3-i23 TaxID=2905871 RepID=UPI002058A454|nr:DUF4097 family beta strand repeat-containing protein [Herbiconiux sp. L3-i23]BDI24017.1 hypothetical protein L3i23_27930 [Herbiconiux sp. L3-i23]